MLLLRDWVTVALLRANLKFSELAYPGLYPPELRRYFPHKTCCSDDVNDEYEHVACIWVRIRTRPDSIHARRRITCKNFYSLWAPNDSEYCLVASQCALYGYSWLLKYVHENGYRFGRFVMINAAHSGSLECLRYAHEHVHVKDAVLNETVAWHAISGDHVNCLRYIHLHVCLPHNFIMKGAIHEGSIKCIRYALENGDDWIVNAPEILAQEGYLKCLQYAIESGCPYDIDLMNRVANTACKKYVQGLPRYSP